MTDLSDLSPTEMIAESERRKARRAAGLPLEDASPKTAPFVDRIETSWLHGDQTTRRVTLPWSVLVPDGEKFQPSIKGGKPFLVLTTRYKQGKAKAREILKEQVGNAPPLAGRISFVATLFEPNASRTRDIVNLAKIVMDSLTAICYVDDGQIDNAQWRRGQVCIDRPRLEISVTEIGK